jgi:hypothetical protein
MSETNPLEEGAKIMFRNLNAVYALHAEDDQCCKHCSQLKGKPIYYPCPTVYLLLDGMKEETPAE